ncbi:MAG: hypothetical protein P8Y95_13305 [Gammaproteobacteria bacterium]|jgi:hypothetical protein
MIQSCTLREALLGTLGTALSLAVVPAVLADEPCGDIDECRIYIEINASDGDIGFHALIDAEDWFEARIIGPEGQRIFDESAHRALRDQKLTQNFFESSEPVCEVGLVEEEDDEVVTLPEFLERFPEGAYAVRVKLEEGGELAGLTIFTHAIPAAPDDVDFDGSEISWEYGSDLGECETQPDGFMLLEEDDIAGYEVVLEPEDEALSRFKFTVQVPPDVSSVTVPSEYLDALEDDVALKVEVGAIEERPNGSFGNQTFTEEDGFCNNSNQNRCPGEE